MTVAHNFLYLTNHFVGFQKRIDLCQPCRPWPCKLGSAVFSQCISADQLRGCCNLIVIPGNNFEEAFSPAGCSGAWPTNRSRRALIVDDVRRNNFFVAIAQDAFEVASLFFSGCRSLRCWCRARHGRSGQPPNRSSERKDMPVSLFWSPAILRRLPWLHPWHDDVDGCRSPPLSLWKDRQRSSELQYKHEWYHQTGSTPMPSEDDIDQGQTVGGRSI